MPLICTVLLNDLPADTSTRERALHEARWARDAIHAGEVLVADAELEVAKYAYEEADPAGRHFRARAPSRFLQGGGRDPPFCVPESLTPARRAGAPP